MQSRQGMMHFRIKGKRDKIPFVPMHPMAQRLIEEYLAFVSHAADVGGPRVPSGDEIIARASSTSRSTDVRSTTMSSGNMPAKQASAQRSVILVQMLYALAGLSAEWTQRWGLHIAGL
jgi:hypothetical protein